MLVYRITHNASRLRQITFRKFRDISGLEDEMSFDKLKELQLVGSNLRKIMNDRRSYTSEAVVGPTYQTLHENARKAPQGGACWSRGKRQSKASHSRACWSASSCVNGPANADLTTASMIMY